MYDPSDTPTLELSPADLAAIERAAAEMMGYVKAGQRPPSWEALVEKHRRAAEGGGQ